MTYTVRRVVTGHNEDGRAIVTIDEISTDVSQPRKGANVTAIWSTDIFPARNDGSEDEAKRSVATTVPTGTVFRLIEFGPGNDGRMHRTASVDYVVILKGEIDMELDDGAEVHMKAGDVMVQRGTMHSWVNRGAESCLLAVVLTGGAPLKIGPHDLPEIG